MACSSFYQHFACSPPLPEPIVTEYGGHLFRVANVRDSTLDCRQSRDSVLDSGCVQTTMLSAAVCRSRDTNIAFLLACARSRDINSAL